ncbi:MAG: winged helix-turn-helix domain-containing protein [Aquificaceae bacterium]
MKRLKQWKEKDKQEGTMNKDGVSEAFGILLEEIKGVIEAIKEKAKSALEGSNYDLVKEYTEKAKSLEDFKNKVIALQKEWENSYIPKLLKEGGEEIKIERTEYTSRRARYTQPEEFIIPILESLVEMGGHGWADEVLKKVEEKMKGRLTEADYEKLPNSKEMRWKNYARWCRKRLVGRGLISNSSPRGIWEITERGRSYLEKYKNEKEG